MPRKPTPTAIRKLQGNPGKRPLPKREPKPRVEAPKMPTGLSKAAQNEWKRLVAECVRLKIITTLDHSLLRSYIHEWQMCEHLFGQCKNHGTYISDTVIDRNGNAYQTNIKRAPWDTSLAQHQSILRGIRSDLGFTPTARTKVSVVEDEEPKKADLLAFDGGKR